jgi:hypothetical protein
MKKQQFVQDVVIPYEQHHENIERAYFLKDYLQENDGRLSIVLGDHGSINNALTLAMKIEAVRVIFVFSVEWQQSKRVRVKDIKKDEHGDGERWVYYKNL